MSSQSLMKFLTKLDEEFERKTTAEKRLEYNLNTHVFHYSETIFIEEMLKEFRSKSIRMTANRKSELERFAKIFSVSLYSDLSGLQTRAKRLNGITRLTGSATAFTFVFTTDIRTGKTPNGWANGEADVFDKIKKMYSKSYSSFFYGVRDSLGKKGQAREKFEEVYKNKGQAGQSGHAENEGIVETMTREYFDRHSNAVFNADTNEVLTENALLQDLAKLGIHLTFMRNTSDMVQNISLIGAGGNLADGREVKKKLKEAKENIKKIIAGKEEGLNLYKLEGSDSFDTINKKRTRSRATTPFKKLKNKNVEVDVKATDLKIKHSKKTVKTEKKNSKSKKGRAVKASIAVKGLSDLSKGSSKRRPTQASPLQDMLKMIGVINARLPQVVRKNMGTPELNNVTGRIANSVQVTEVIKTPQGFPSIGYTYQKAPYQVFEDGVGAAPWANGQRDPRNLIDRSIREISAEMFVGRLYTRRI